MMNTDLQKKTLSEKILIIGSAGSGKTRLAKQLSKIMKLPIIHLDYYYWDKNWSKKPDDQWNEIVQKLCKQPKWIMDGNYTKTLPIRIQYATTIIYLDIPRYLCLLRVILRRFRWFYNKKRNDIPENCKERVNLEFYRWIWNYPVRSRNETLAQLKIENKIVFHLKTNREVNKLINKVRSEYNSII